MHIFVYVLPVPMDDQEMIQWDEYFPQGICW